MLALLEEVRLKVKSWAILLISFKTTVKYFLHLPCCYILQWIWQHRISELLNSELLNVEDTSVTLKLDFVINWKNTAVESENVVTRSGTWSSSGTQEQKERSWSLEEGVSNLWGLQVRSEAVQGEN